MVADQSNEIPAFPELLKTLKLKGTLVTIDAVVCQTAVVDAIRDGDCLLSVKGNQPDFLAAVKVVFADAAEKEFVGVGATHHEAIERDEAKISKPRKAFRAALNTKYLEKLLRGNAVIEMRWPCPEA